MLLPFQIWLSLHKRSAEFHYYSYYYYCVLPCLGKWHFGFAQLEGYSLQQSVKEAVIDISEEILLPLGARVRVRVIVSVWLPTPPSQASVSTSLYYHQLDLRFGTWTCPNLSCASSSYSAYLVPTEVRKKEVIFIYMMVSLLWLDSHCLFSQMSFIIII